MKEYFENIRVFIYGKKPSVHIKYSLSEHGFSFTIETGVGERIEYYTNVAKSNIEMILDFISYLNTEIEEQITRDLPF